jgi:Cytochrome C'
MALTCCRSTPDAPAPSNDRAPPCSRESPAAPEAALAAVDQRTSVPLLPMMAHHQKQNMRDHLLAVREIVTALGTEDFDAVQSAVSRLGYSDQMGRMCQHMGAGAPGFTELALKFHHTADKIGDAAKRRDTNGVIAALSDTLAACTSCHESFRQQIVDETAWAALTKTTPDPSGAR